ncbi:TetR/AcrR family transcriptional regulator [Mechercharimyces sp. CAU 1602]|uniref:TetR/AcrR family transcriptional regulator n=1 Tax=Mechercharimyces sp. CAU 1602 TaxID=2973933 RepID=UPI00216262E1|nr:TetR/AcrR family transcriptional regulator [Mechercharimyces sp. CAU 1602]MCS1352538.1 TetR/AcrR family transcriptional regulator [Mechercharimyces sp. CAU 1602]
MGFSRARTSEQKQKRIEEVMEATARLYDTVPYEEITFAAIAKETGFSRSNLYIYFTSKEEILLEILLSDLYSWYENVEASFHVRRSYAVEEIMEVWTDALVRNQRLLSLLSILFTVLEKNVSIEALAKFKRGMLAVQQRCYLLLQGLFPAATEQELQQFLVSSFALAQGLYPMTCLTEYQIKALANCNMEYVPPNFRDSFLQAGIQLAHGLLNK